ncbi:hypothetical protein Q9Q94_01470 [Uliginosibacterium sp. 31-16]|uniref:hypothetical protein n=1 Tax=Uliginosibacterium sp. 31-16 TaxID=3068315 RepID=UPI00273DD680|nr:hypothetical protein [Uliginosibacterium sp. 31-16]MDP5238177.1 hypothetical protein [Uliginosibacterium sp. 31-16]
MLAGEQGVEGLFSQHKINLKWLLEYSRQLTQRGALIRQVAHPCVKDRHLHQALRHNADTLRDGTQAYAFSLLRDIRREHNLIQIERTSFISFIFNVSYKKIHQERI